MKRKLCFILYSNLIVIHFLLLANVAITQTTIQGTIQSVRFSNSINDVYIPPPTASISYREVTIVVNHLGAWTPEQTAAFDFAVDIWEDILTSTQPIIVDARVDQGLPTGVLGSAGPFTFTRDFPSVDPLFQVETFYPSALANKLANDDLISESPDIVANFTTNGALLPLNLSWYYGTDGNPGAGQIDFVTVVLHELGHGLGFSSSARPSNNGTLGYQFLGFPTIYDRFIRNDVSTRLTNLVTPSTTLTNFLQSNNLSWDGTNAVNNNNGTRPQIFAPNPWQNGSSISHWNETSFPAGNPNSLMTPELGAQEAIHNVGTISHGLMRDIGWDLDASVGIEDKLNISYSPSNLVFTQGQSFNFSAQFVDEEPYGDFIPALGYNWKLELYHSTGTLNLHQKLNAYSSWTGLLNYLPFTLPNGFNWARNNDGTVKGRIKVFATDNGGTHHEDSYTIGIKEAPAQPVVAIDGQQNVITQTASTCKPTITFYAPGATITQFIGEQHQELPTLIQLQFQGISIDTHFQVY